MWSVRLWGAFSNFVPPFKNPNCVIAYLGRYTHRVAISNNRILKLENGNVTFKWRDCREGKKEKLMTVKADEFIRRFLLHILPERFTKIRHYGLLCSRDKTSRLNLCKKPTLTPVISHPKEKASPLQLLQKLVLVNKINMHRVVIYGFANFTLSLTLI
jgi:Putative transposase.